jgi:regulator of telomere elongation helicase 1
MLVFFPSYVAMNGALDSWKLGSAAPGNEVVTTIWGRLAELKTLFVEPTDGKELSTVIRAFQEAADRAPGNGALLFAVCRGKVSEGVDFSDNHGRCVVVTGIPYANHSDLFVRLKREYITQMAPRRPKVQGKLFTGDDWYRNEAMRAVNQCVGRVIRHKDDYGAVIFADERFVHQKNSISHWLRTQLQTHEHFRDAYRCISEFFAQRRITRQPGPSDERTCAGVRPMLSVPPVPEEAGKAREFVEERHRQLAQEQKSKKDEGAHGMTSGYHYAEPAVLVNPTHRFQKYELPSTAAPLVSESAVDPHPGITMDLTSSRDFCSFVKAKVDSEKYEKFKAVVSSIAGLRAESDAQRVKQQFSEEIDRLRGEVLGALPESDRELALVHFGCHIPESYRRFYSHLLRKRKR